MDNSINITKSEEDIVKTEDNIHKPEETGFTIYSKSGCPNCTKIKKILLENKNCFVEINCDEYLIENKEFFLSFIKELINKECNTFPMIFNNGIFIGGFNETQEYLNKQLCFDKNTNF
jgi:glutaredoxin